MTKVSIIIPVHNNEPQLSNCLESVVNQSLEEIEIICIDDESSDRSAIILEEYSKRDKRISIIKYSINKSANQARKDGVLQSRGEYIMFLDADDSLECNACEELYGLMKNDKVDIIQFGSTVINVGDVSKSRIASLEKFLLPCCENVHGVDVLKLCFKEQKFGFTLWNKIYSSELCKRAFSHVSDGFFPKAQDMYAFLIISYFAKSYKGIETKYYNYSFGGGVTGTDSITVKQFERICCQAAIAKQIEKFFLEQGVMEKFRFVYKRVRNNLVNECIHKWFDYLDEKNSKKGFDILIEYWDPELVVSQISSIYFSKKSHIARKVYGANSLSFDKEGIKKIGVYYHRLSIGGVQNVLSKVIPMLIDLGYEVLLFTDEPPAEDDFEIPGEVKRVVIQSYFNLEPNEFSLRADSWACVLRKYQIDVMLYNAASSKVLLFDMLYIKSLKIPFVLSIHELFSDAVTKASIEIVQRPFVYRIADALVVLSSVEREYWNLLGIDATYIPNPLTLNLCNVVVSPLNTLNVLWVGRFDKGKQYLEALEIFSEVVKKIPKAKLYIIGKEARRHATKKIRSLIDTLDIADNVSLLDSQHHMEEHYRNASIHLVTSVSEAFSMTIAESKAFGIPLVLFDMPYLELLKDGKGYISVRQGDIKSAAKAIISLLENEDYRKTMGNEARRSINSFYKTDIQSKWESLFSKIMSNKGKTMVKKKNELSGQVLNALLFHYSIGIGQIRKETDFKIKKKEKSIIYIENKLESTKNKLESTKNELESTKNELKNTKKGPSYRLGRVITYVPRLLREKLSNSR